MINMMINFIVCCYVLLVVNQLITVTASPPPNLLTRFQTRKLWPAGRKRESFLPQSISSPPLSVPSKSPPSHCPSHSRPLKKLTIPRPVSSKSSPWKSAPPPQNPPLSPLHGTQVLLSLWLHLPHTPITVIEKLSKALGFHDSTEAWAHGHLLGNCEKSMILPIKRACLWIYGEAGWET